jgi:hypothetical protein
MALAKPGVYFGDTTMLLVAPGADLRNDIQSPLQRGRPQIARPALIICAIVAPSEANDDKFAKMVSDIKELRAAWPKRLEIGLMEAAEFQEVLFTLIRRNLQAAFSEDVNRDEVVQRPPSGRRPSDV